jgi:excisionase family DNA binding protein
VGPLVGRPGLDLGTLGLKEGSDQSRRCLGVGNALKRTETRASAWARFVLGGLVGGMNRGILRRRFVTNQGACASSAGRPHTTLPLSDPPKVRTVEGSCPGYRHKTVSECDIALLSPSTSPKMLVTILEAANLLSISRSTMYELLNSGAIPSFHIGRSRRIRAHDLEAFVSKIKSG